MEIDLGESSMLLLQLEDPVIVEIREHCDHIPGKVLNKERIPSE
jgi:hypothetical protein